MKTYIFNHTSLETALEVKDYPYGFRLRTSIFYWIESVPKKGDRFCSCTRNPKNGLMNAPKKSTFSNIGVMYSDEKGHIHWHGVTIYTKQDELKAFIESVGESNLNEHQKIQLRQLRGEKVVLNRDKITGDAKKDFAVKWEYDKADDSYSEVKITFDRPDGVSAKEIFEAMRTLNQEKLERVWNGWYSKTFGQTPGFVRVCVRGGMQLTTVNEDSYKEYLASDHVTAQVGIKEDEHYAN
jgi:hypothetical protein